MIRVAAFGVPMPKGSMKIVNGRILADNPAKLRRWSNTVAGAALAAMHHTQRAMFCEHAIVVAVEYRLLRPPSHFTKAGQIKPSAPRWPSVKPDLDKLTRAAMDPLEGIVFDNDSRIVERYERKIYSPIPGAWIAIWSREEDEQPCLFDWPASHETKRSTA